VVSKSAGDLRQQRAVTRNLGWLAKPASTRAVRSAGLRFADLMGGRGGHKLYFDWFWRLCGMLKVRLWGSRDRAERGGLCTA